MASRRRRPQPPEHAHETQLDAIAARAARRVARVKADLDGEERYHAKQALRLFQQRAHRAQKYPGTPAPTEG